MADNSTGAGAVRRTSRESDSARRLHSTALSPTATGGAGAAAAGSTSSTGRRPTLDPAMQRPRRNTEGCERPYSRAQDASAPTYSRARGASTVAHGYPGSPSVGDRRGPPRQRATPHQSAIPPRDVAPRRTSLGDDTGTKQHVGSQRRLSGPGGRPPVTPQSAHLPKSWECHVCTYIHADQEASFLACKICAAPTLNYHPLKTTERRVDSDSLRLVQNTPVSKEERMSRVAEWTATLPPTPPTAATGEYHTVDPDEIWPSEDGSSDAALPQAQLDRLVVEQLAHGIVSVDDGAHTTPHSVPKHAGGVSGRSIHAKPIPMSMVVGPSSAAGPASSILPPRERRRMPPQASPSPPKSAAVVALSRTFDGVAPSLGPATFGHPTQSGEPNPHRLPKRSSAPTETVSRVQTRQVSIRVQIEYRAGSEGSLGFTLRAGSARTGGSHIISQVESGSAASASGLLVGDIIEDVGGERVASLHTPVVCETIQELVSLSRYLDLGLLRNERTAMGEPRRHVSNPDVSPGSVSTSTDVTRRSTHSLADLIRRKPKRTLFNLHGLPIQAAGDPGLENVGSIMRTGPLMYWPCASGGLSPEKMKGKSRAIILTERCMLVCKLKGAHFNLKSLIQFDVGTQIKPLSVATFTGSQSGGFLCAFAVVLRDSTQHVFAAETVVAKRLWLSALEKLLRRIGVANPYGDAATASVAAALTSQPSRSAGGLADRTQQKWEMPRGAFTLDSELQKECRGTWHSGCILGKTRCMIKIFTKGLPDTDIKAEVDLLKMCQHPNVVQLICTSSHDDGSMWLVTELLLVSIAEFLEVQGATLPPSVLAPMMVQIADAVAFVHDHGIVHRCVSNKTVYVDAGYTCKLAHFVSAEQESTSGGSRPEGLQIRWTAPEALSHGVFSKAADVWSLAVLSYVVISNQGSIWAHVEDAALVNLLNEGIRLPQPVGMPNSLYDFLMMCWADNAGARPPASAFARGLAFDGDLNRRSIVDHISQSVVGTYKLMQPDGVVAQDEDDPTYAYPAEPDFAPEDVIASFTSATDALAASSSDEEEADDVVGTVPPLPVYHLGNSAEDPLYHDQQVTLGAISEAASPAITPGYGQKQSFDSITRRQPSEASSYHGHVRGSIISDNDVPTSPGGTRPTTVWHPSHAAAAASSPSLHAHVAPLPPSNPFAALSQGELVRDDRAPVGRPRANSKLEMLRARELNQLDFSEDL